MPENPDDRPVEEDGTDELPRDEAPTGGLPPDETAAEEPPTDESSTSEPSADDATGRSPVGAMDRSSGELGPAGEGTHPDASADDLDSTDNSGDEPGSSRAAGDADDRSDEPLSELRDELSERGEADVEDEEFEELFEEIDVGTVDEESVWDQLSETADEPLFTADVEEVPDADVTVVEKRLCHRCPHFGDPPELHCTHEGTTIDAEVDTEHFRVVNCPIVAQRTDVDASDFSTDDL